jgi:hypothetical protein
MRIYIGFDDTDTLDADRGTGKLARWFEGELPQGCRLWGVVRQQLLVDPAIPYTSHNSSACVVVETPDASVLDTLIARAQKHIKRHFLPGSDPGLCVACEDVKALPLLQAFGRRATAAVVAQREAMEAAEGVHLSGHGGTNDGIIGAAAAVGLTSQGWSGRLIEYEPHLRSFANPVRVADLEQAGIAVVSVDRDAPVPAPSHLVDTQQWLRPRLWGGRAALPVQQVGPDQWRSLGAKGRSGEEVSAD